jgi:outer membrane receptor for ferrienterochelin and colicin
MQDLRRTASLLFCLLLALGVAASAQTPTGSIEGTITDQTGAVVAGATVTVTETATGRALTATTGDEGFFTVRNLQPGVYTVKVEKTGFKISTIESLTVQVGQVARADAGLQIGAQSEIVEVSSGDNVQTVDTTRQTVDGVINARQIENLPLNSRNALDLAELQPSVVVRDGGAIDPTKTGAYRTVGVNGASGTGTRITVDGIDVTDETVGTTLSNISTDAVQEFQLSRSSFDLSTSLTSSGAVNIVTRRGSNEFRGSAFHFFQNQDLAARPDFLAEERPFSRRQQGYRFGGPILKNKLFFFSNFENNLQKTQDQVTFLGSAFSRFNGTAQLPIDYKYATNRLDYVLNNNVNLFYSHRYSDDFSTSTAQTPLLNVNTTNVHTIGGDIVTGKFTHSLRFGYVNFNNRIDSIANEAFPFTTVGGTTFGIIVTDPDLINTYFFSGPNSLAPQQTYQDNRQFKYDGSMTFGSHVIRFGGEVNRIKLGGFANFSGPPTAYGEIDPLVAQGSTQVDPLSLPLIEFSLGPNSGFFTPEPAHNLPFGGKRNTRYAIYGGDTWKILPNLTVSAGVRWNYESNFFGKEGRALPILDVLYGQGTGAVAKFPKNAFSPQIGFAWDPFKDGKTSVRGGFYLSYENNIFNNTLFDTSNRIAPGIGPLVTFNFQNLRGPDGTAVAVAIPEIAACNTTAAQAEIAAGIYNCLNGTILRNALPVIGRINNALQAAYAANLSNYDPNRGLTSYEATGGNTSGGIFPGDYKIPYALQFNIGIQRELFKDTVLSIDYVRNHGVGLPFTIRDIEYRRDARYFNEAAARSRISTVTGIAPANINPTTIGAFLAANPNANFDTFGLSTNTTRLDTIFPGLTAPNAVLPGQPATNNFVRTRIVDGGFSLYNALQLSLNGRVSNDALGFLSIGGQNLVKDMNYTVSYALGNAKATDASGRGEFIAGTFNNREPNSPDNFGPTTLDRKHIFTASTSFTTLGGVRIDQIWRFRSAPAQSLFIPAVDGLDPRSQLFTTDINGDGSAGGTVPRPDLLPGTSQGDLGRRFRTVEQINAVIRAFNTNYAGSATPAGHRLIAAGIFNLQQLQQLGAVMQPIALIPEGNPLPFDNLFSLDLRITRPIRFGERFEIEPSVSIFNVFNNTPLGNLGFNALDGSFGSLNYDYNTAEERAALNEIRGRSLQTRQIQFGIRFTF